MKFWEHLSCCVFLCVTGQTAAGASPEIATVRINNRTNYLLTPSATFCRCLHLSLRSTVFGLLGDVLSTPLFVSGDNRGPCCQVTVNAGDEDAARDALEALNVVAVKKPQLLTEGEGLDVAGKAMLALAASPALEVRVESRGGGRWMQIEGCALSRD